MSFDFRILSRFLQAIDVVEILGWDHWIAGGLWQICQGWIDESRVDSNLDRGLILRRWWARCCRSSSGRWRVRGRCSSFCHRSIGALRQLPCKAGSVVEDVMSYRADIGRRRRSATLLRLQDVSVRRVHRTRWTVRVLLRMMRRRWHTLTGVLHDHSWRRLHRARTVAEGRLRRWHLLVRHHWTVRHRTRRRRNVEVRRIDWVALAVVAVVRWHGRTRHRWDWRDLLAPVRVLQRNWWRLGLRIGFALSWRGRTVSWTLQASRVDIWRRPDLGHWRRLSIIPPRLMTLALETGGRLVARQLTGSDCVRQRVGTAVATIARGGNRTKSHWAARMAHDRRLRVRNESWHGLHARHGATPPIGASLPISSGRTDSRSHRSSVVVRIRTARIRMRRS